MTRPAIAAAVLAALLAGCSASTARQVPSSAAPPTTIVTPAVAHPTTDAPARSAPPGTFPDPARTPGALNPAVTKATIGTTICASGWTTTVRPPESYTEQVKRQLIDGGYSVHGDTRLADYELDHFVPLELGGSPTSIANLWPEPTERSGLVPAGYGSESKDRVEDRLREEVCAGRLPLAAAQDAIRSDWRAAP